MDIKSVIRSHGYTLEKVASEWKDKNGNASPITKGALSKSINNNPTISTLQGIATVIGCRVGDFFRDEISPEASGHAITCPHCGKEIQIRVEAAP